MVELVGDAAGLVHALGQRLPRSSGMIADRRYAANAALLEPDTFTAVAS